MYYAEARCSKCNYKKWISGPRAEVITCVYRLPFGYFFQADKEVGWCSSCKDIGSIETLKTDEFLVFAKRFTLLEQKVIQEKGINIIEKIKKLSEYRWARYNLNKLHKFISMREHPKCLKCGTQMVSRVDFSAPFEHPICGGNLVLHEWDDEVNWSYKSISEVRHYAVSGDYLFTKKYT